MSTTLLFALLLAGYFGAASAVGEGSVNLPEKSQTEKQKQQKETLFRQAQQLQGGVNPVEDNLRSLRLELSPPPPAAEQPDPREPPEQMRGLVMAPNQMRHLYANEIGTALANDVVKEFIKIPAENLYEQVKFVLTRLYGQRFHAESVDFFWQNLWSISYEDELLVGGGRCYGVFEMRSRMDPDTKNFHRFYQLRFDRGLLADPALLLAYGPNAYHAYRFFTVSHEIGHGISAALEFHARFIAAVQGGQNEAEAWQTAWVESRRFMVNKVAGSDDDHSARFQATIAVAFLNAGFDNDYATKLARAQLPPGHPRGQRGEYGPGGPQQ